MTGFRFDTAKIKNRLARVNAELQAISFRPDIEKFATASLKSAIALTPVRSVSLIEANQIKQFHHRQRYIAKNPSSATRVVSEAQFVKERSQARFLYRKSWKQCADSVRLRVSASAAVSSSVTRRRPAVNPPRGFAQWRGGGRVLSLTIFNPFLNQPSRFKDFNATQIINKALAKHRPKFKRDIENRIRREIYAASRI